MVFLIPLRNGVRMKKGFYFWVKRTSYIMSPLNMFDEILLENRKGKCRVKEMNFFSFHSFWVLDTTFTMIGQTTVYLPPIIIKLHFYSKKLDSSRKIYDSDGWWTSVRKSTSKQFVFMYLPKDFWASFSNLAIDPSTSISISKYTRVVLAIKTREKAFKMGKIAPRSCGKARRVAIFT